MHQTLMNTSKPWKLKLLIAQGSHYFQTKYADKSVQFFCN